MIDVSRIAKSAGIGSAIGAVGGLIKATNDSEPDTSSNILGGIVGGAIAGSVGGAGISAAKQIAKIRKQPIDVDNLIKRIDDLEYELQPDSGKVTFAFAGLRDILGPAADQMEIAKKIAKTSAGNTHIT